MFINILKYLLPALLNKLDEYSEAGLLILGVISLTYVRKEYLLKRRPFVDTEVIFRKNKDENDKERWDFLILLVNQSNFPTTVKIKKMELIIGEDKYPSENALEIPLAPLARTVAIHIGHINELGIDKIRRKQYLSNECLIVIEFEYKPIDEQAFKYKRYSTFEVDVTGDNPVFKLKEVKAD